MISRITRDYSRRLFSSNGSNPTFLPLSVASPEVGHLNSSSGVRTLHDVASDCRDRHASSLAGMNQPGVSYQFQTTLPAQWDMMGSGASWIWDKQKQARACTQLPQSAYSPLLLPFVLVGLGQTSDYVQELQIGLPSGQARLFSQAVIPNSRLVIFPYPYTEPWKWELRLYLEARQQVYVALALAGALVLLAIIILLLELQERVQDAREKRALAPALPL